MGGGGIFGGALGEGLTAGGGYDLNALNIIGAGAAVPGLNILADGAAIGLGIGAIFGLFS